MSGTSKIINLMKALSRIPGLRFLNAYTRHIRTAENVKNGIVAFKKKDDDEDTDKLRNDSYD